MNGPLFALSVLSLIATCIVSVGSFDGARGEASVFGFQRAGDLEVLRLIVRRSVVRRGPNRQIGLVQFRSAAGQPQCRKGRGRLRFAAKPRNFSLLVFVLGFAGRAARLFHFRADHRDDGVVGNAAFTRAIVVQNVTKPKLALLHRKELPT
jgi:hypothetical protein